MAVTGNFNLTDMTALFKDNYDKLSENVYNSFNVTLGRVKKNFTFTGKRRVIAVPQGYAGGVGSGTLPRANFANTDDALITAKRMYSRIEIERESMKASANDAGAFVRATRWQVGKGVESWMRNMSRSLFGTGDGKVADYDGVTAVVDNGGGNFDVTLAAGTKVANVEERDYWHFNLDSSADALLEVISYNETTRVVELQECTVGGSSLAAGVLGATPFYMQFSKDNDPQGLRNVLTATAGTLYGIPVDRRWSAGSNEASGGSGLTTDMLNEDMLRIEQRSGKVPTMIVASYTQYRKLLNLLEDHKRYELPARAANLKGQISFSGIEFMSSRGPIPVFPERFVEDDSLYYINDNFVEIHHRPDFGWFDDDGTVLLRKADSDDYEARYGGYLETYITPNFHGIRTGLAT